MPDRSFPSWLSSILPLRRRGKKRPAGNTRPKLEYLEDRVVPTGTAIDLSISPAQLSIHGGDSSNLPGSAVFTVTRTGNQAAFHVGFHTVDGTAKAGTDYTAEDGDLPFAAGVDTATISVPIMGDNIDNGNKTFSVQLFNETQFQTFAAYTLSAAYPRKVDFADINGDGRPDLVTAEYDNSEAEVFLNTTPRNTTKVSFSAPTILKPNKGHGSTGKTDFDVEVGDFNGDGKPDVLLADGNAGYVSLFINTTPKNAKTATFAPAYDIPIKKGDSLKFLTVGNFNGDGKLDFAVSDATANTVDIVLQDKTSTPAKIKFDLAQVAKYSVSNPFILDTTDVNGDGRPDILVGTANGATPTYSTYLLVNTTPKGSFPATFSPQSFATGPNPASIAGSYTTLNGTVKYPDFNGDGKPDIAWADLYSSGTGLKGGEVTAALNTTTKKSPPPASFNYSNYSPYSVATGYGPRQIQVGDLNGDGVLDLVTANRDYSFAPAPPPVTYQHQSISIIVNDTPKGSQVPDLVRQPFNFQPTSVVKPRSIALGDVNGDGKLDLAICDFDYATKNVAIFLNVTPTIVFLRKKATVTIINDNVPTSLVVTPATATSFTTEVGTAFNPGPSVTAFNKFGDTVQDAPVTFTVPKSGSGVATALLNGTFSLKGTTNASGVAALDGVTNPFAQANTVAGGPYTLTATSGIFTQTFSMTNTPGPVAMLKFFGQPLTTSIGSNLNPNGVTVEEVDQYGNLAPTTADTITLSLNPATNPQGAQLSGNLGATYGSSVTATASGGIATFNNLAVDTEGKNYQLEADATVASSGLAISGFSNAFGIRGPATSFGLTAVGSGSSSVGVHQAAQLNVPTVITIQAFDALGQPAGSPTVTNVVITNTTGSAQLTFRNASADGNTLYYILDSHTVGTQTYQITATVGDTTISSTFTLATLFGSKQF